MPFVADAPDAVAPLAPPPASGFVPDGPPPVPPPNMAQGNKSFASVLGNFFASPEVKAIAGGVKEIRAGAEKTVLDMGQVYPALEAALNAGTGVALGLPALLGGAIGGMAHAYGVVTPFGKFGGDDPDYDYAAMAHHLQELVTYQPQTAKGQRLSGSVNSLMSFGSTVAGQGVSSALVKLGDPGGMAAISGAITEQAIQMLAPALVGELSRKLGGQTVGAEDISNAAKVAVPGATPAQIPAIERSLRSVYDETGIGPYTILKDAAKDPSIRADLVDPTVGVPNAYRQYTDEFSGPIDETPESLPRATPEAKAAVQEQLSAVDQGEATQRQTSGPGTFNSGLNPADVLKAVRDTVADVKEVTNGIVNSEIGREVVSSVMPMSAGSEVAQATAQKFANSMRVARFQWQRMSEFLGDEFTPEERRAMWEAGEAENTIRTTGEDTGKGIVSLNPRQQKVMGELHELGENLWSRAKATGMVQGEGVPYWVTRMAVQIGEDGEAGRLPSGGEGAFTSDVKGLSTTASSLKQRKYLTADETEAAMKAKFGDNAQLVRDIQTMPIAMSRLAQAISGRELISQLKELGQVSGTEIVSEAMKPGFTTINHPAFTTYKPEFVQDAEGKMVPRVDADGNIVMQRTPMLIASDWAGPLKAVLSTKDGALYSALMLAKSKAMTAIMISPAAHNMVIFGRALAYDPVALLSLRAYFEGNSLAKDAALMNRAIGHGLVPIGANKGSMLDITDVARTVGKEGGWGDPNESWINKSAQKVASIFSDELGTTVKQKLDAFGDFWHHTLLWKQVGAIQTYIYNDYFNHMVDGGHPPEVAGPIAANLANRYGGAVAAENSSEWVRKALNLTLFSRSFNVGNIGAVHDAALGMPAGLRALMTQEAGPAAADAGLNAARFKARLGLVTDLGMSMLMTAVASAAVAKLLLNQTAEDIKNGYVRRLEAMVGNIKEHPLNPTSYNPYRILPTYENEAGKQDRIDLGAQPGGRHEYVRLPTGKVVEDTVGWMLHAPDTFEKKLSPLARSLWESVTNNKGYGVPVEDPDGNTIKHIAQGLQHILAAQVPMEQIKPLWDVSQGTGTPIDKDKLIGFATGFTTSQGNPRGPEEAAFYAQQDRIEQEKKYAMEAVRDDIKNGRDAQAYARLSTIGVPPREIVQTINNIKNPRQGMSRQQTRKFIAEATPEDRAALTNAQRQIQE